VGGSGVFICSFFVPSQAGLDASGNPTLALWLDATDALNTGINAQYGSLATWYDKSTYTSNAAAGVAGTLTAMAINGKPAVFFDGSTNYYAGTLSNTSSALSVFTAGYLNSNAAYPIIASNARVISLGCNTLSDTATSGYVSLGTSSSNAVLASRRGGVMNTSGSYAFNTPFYAATEYSGTSNFSYIGGVNSNLVSNAPGASSGNFAISNYAIGRDVGSAAGYWNGYIGEILVYASYLNDYDRFRLQTYLSNKWSLVFPTVTVGNASLGQDFTITSNNGRTYYNFLTPGKTMTLTVTGGPLYTNWLAVGGGGGGGSNCGGGGGAGGILSNTAYALAPGNYTITVGAGGAGGSGVTGTAGSATVFNGFTANGGGYGGSNSVAGGGGGSGGGGGGGNTTVVLGGNGNQGGNYNGGTGSVGAVGTWYGAGGGGGAGSIGSNGASQVGGAGGTGITWYNTASGTQLGGGGGGGSYAGASGTAGTATFGGGAGIATNSSVGTSGTANTGGGGGGGSGGGGGGGGVGGSGLFSIGFPTNSAILVAAPSLANAGTNDAFLLKMNTNGQPLWATRVAGSGGESGNGVATDSQGNVYMLGMYTSSPVTVYNADGSTFGTIANAGNSDIFLVKYNTLGVAQWAARVGGAGSDAIYAGQNSGGHAIVVDSSGNVYFMASYASNPITLYNANGSSSGITLANGGVQNAGIFKYNTYGVAQWAARYGGTGTDIPCGIAVDSTGNVYVCGYYSSTTLSVYNSGGGVTLATLANAGSNDSIVVKYNSSGVAQWAARMGGTGSDTASDISVDSAGNVYVCGTFGATAMTIYNSSGSASGLTLTAAGSAGDGFLVKYNTSGTAQWATRQIDTLVVVPNECISDTAGNVYIVGYWRGVTGTLTLYNSDTTAFGTTLTGPNSSSVNYTFLTKYSSAGFVQWAVRLVSSASTVGTGICFDASGNICISGYTNSALTAYNSDGTLFRTLNYNAGSDAFFIEYTSSGIGQWATRAAGTADEFAVGVAGDTLGNIYSTGGYSSSTLNFFYPNT
jgi:hypothetical protein